MKHFLNKFTESLNEEYLFLSVDLIIVTLSFFLSGLLKFDFNVVMALSHDMDYSSLQYIILLLAYFCSFRYFKIQKSILQYTSSREIVKISVSVAVSTTFIIIFNAIFYYNHPNISSIMIMTGVISLVFMLMYRMLFIVKGRQVSGGEKRERVLIIGAGNAGYILVKEFNQSDKLSAYIVGFIDDNKVNKTIAGYSVLGTIKDIPEIIEKHKVDVVYIAMPSAGHEVVQYIFSLCVVLPVKVKIMHEISEFIEGQRIEKVPIQDISIEDLLGRGVVKLDQEEIGSYLTGRCVMVTGAGGSIGSELCRQISKFKPMNILMVDVNENGLYMLEQEFDRKREHGLLDVNIRITSYVTSIRDYKAVSEIMKAEKPSVVFHAAAHKHVPLMELKPKEAIKNNIFGSNNVIHSCIKNNVEKFIMISTDKAVNPTSVMGASKRMTEVIMQAYSDNGVTKMSAVRFGNVLGSNGSVIPIFKNQILEGGPITITDNAMTRYFMTIPEAAQLVLQAGYYTNKGEIFVLDMGKQVKILDLAEKLIRLSGLQPYKDIEIKEIGLREGEKMYEELRLEGEKQEKTTNDLIFVNEPMEISQEKVSVILEELSAVIDKPLDRLSVKAILMDAIKETNYIITVKERMGLKNDQEI